MSARDIIMITPSSTSTPAWMNKLVGAGADVGNGIAVDSVGNSYITGQIQTGTEYDAVLVKYNSSGTLQWQVTIGAASIVDVGYCITVDSSSNVYIGGQTGTTCILAKYNTSGTLIWQKTYGLNANDKLTGITTDSSGFIYTVGYMEGNFIGLTRSVGFVCKYDLDGVIQFNTAIHYATANYVYISSITIDTSGNIYVVGNVTSISRGVIIKLNSSGIQQWAKQLPTGAEKLYGVVTDSSGNIYGIGTNTSHNIDIILIKFNPSGIIQWSRQLANGNTLSRNDSGLGICIDSLDKIYIIGSSSTTTTGTLGYDIFVAKYNTDGTQQWQRTIANSTASTDIGYAVTATLTNIYITGMITQTNSDIFTACLPSDGTKVGTYVIGTTSMVYSSSTLTETVLTYTEADSLIDSSFLGGRGLLADSGLAGDNFRDVTIDATGNIYIIGSAATATTISLYICKYSSTGTLAWSKSLNLANSYIRGLRITLSANNEIYTTGYDTSNALLLLVKWAENGVLQWKKQLSPTSSSYFTQIPSGLTVDSLGNVYIAATQGNSILSVIKYNSNGVLQWQKIITGSTNTATAIAVDSGNNLYIVGKYGSNLGILKLDNNGNAIWKKYASNITASEGYAIKINATNDVYLAGNSGAATPFLCKFDTSGNLDWSKGIALGTFGATYQNLIIDSFGNIICCGHYKSGSAASTQNILITRYSSSGVCKSAINLGSNTATDTSTGVAVNSTGLAYLAGETGNPSNCLLLSVNEILTTGTSTFGSYTFNVVDMMSSYNFNTGSAGGLIDAPAYTLTNGSIIDSEAASYSVTDYVFPTIVSANSLFYPSDKASSLISGTASLISTTVTI